ncbi:MAG: hypothetical protein V1791_06415 [Pseudomonadota bacterium]
MKMEYFESEIPKTVGRRPPEKTGLAGHGGTPLDRTIKMKLTKQIESLTTDELLAWISNSLTVSCMFGFMAGMVLAFSLTHLNSNHSAFDFAAVISALFLLGLLFWGHRFATRVVIPEIRKRYQNEKP